MLLFYLLSVHVPSIDYDKIIEYQFSSMDMDGSYLEYKHFKIDLIHFYSILLKRRFKNIIGGV